MVGVLNETQPAKGRPRGDGWAICETHREFIAQHLKHGVRLTRIGKLLRRRSVEVSYDTVRRFAAAELGLRAVCAHRAGALPRSRTRVRGLPARLLGARARRRPDAEDVSTRALPRRTARPARGGPVLVDDFGLDAMDAQESRDAHEIIVECHRAGSMIVTSNRRPDEWLAAFADPVRALAAIDRFTSNAYDLVTEDESYRARLKPSQKLD